MPAGGITQTENSIFRAESAWGIRFTGALQVCFSSILFIRLLTDTSAEYRWILYMFRLIRLSKNLDWKCISIFRLKRKSPLNLFNACWITQKCRRKATKRHFWIIQVQGFFVYKRKNLALFLICRFTTDSVVSRQMRKTDSQSMALNHWAAFLLLNAVKFPNFTEMLPQKHLFSRHYYKRWSRHRQ